MNKKTIFIGLFIFVFVGLVCFVIQKQFQSLIPEDNGQSAVVKNTEKPLPPKTNISINDLVIMDKPLKCTVLLEENTSSTKQALTIFVDNSRVRIVNKTSPADKSIPLNSLIMNGFRYTWPIGGVAEKGEKLDIAAVTKEIPNASQITQGFGMDARMNLDCSPWEVDEQEFSLPKEVAFEDITKKTEDSLVPPAGDSEAPAK